MEITVKCECGQPFRFEDEPVGGRLKFPVSCPNCGADGTAKANDFIAAAISGSSTLREEPKSGGFLSKFKKTETQDDFDMRAKKATSDDVENQQPKKVNLALGAAGAVGAGVLGALGWFYLAKATGFEFGIVAWVIGGLVGLGARLFVPQGSFALAGVAGLSAAMAIMGGGYLTTKHFVDVIIDKTIARAYDETMAYAKEATKLADDEATKAFLAKHEYKLKSSVDGEAGNASGSQYRFLARMEWQLYGIMRAGDKKQSFANVIEASDPDSITAADLKEFREKELPELVDFVGGKPTRPEFEATLQQMVRSRVSQHDMIVQSWGVYTFLWLFLGVGTAYRIAYNKSETVDD